MWIKTTDRLPKENEQVILYWNEAYRGWYNWDNYTCLVWDDWESFSGITHWTPLPDDDNIEHKSGWTNITDSLPKKWHWVLWSDWFFWYVMSFDWDSWATTEKQVYPKKWQELPNHDHDNDMTKSLVLAERDRIISIIHERIRGGFDKDCILTWIIEEIRNLH